MDIVRQSWESHSGGRRFDPVHLHEITQYFGRTTRRGSPRASPTLGLSPSPTPSAARSPWGMVPRFHRADGLIPGTGVSDAVTSPPSPQTRRYLSAKRPLRGLRPPVRCGGSARRGSGTLAFLALEEGDDR